MTLFLLFSLSPSPFLSRPLQLLFLSLFHRRRFSLRLDAQSLAKFTPRRLSMAVAGLPHYELITETVADNFAIKVPARAVLLTLLRSLSVSPSFSRVLFSPLPLPRLFFLFLFLAVGPSASRERYAVPTVSTGARIPTNNGRDKREAQQPNLVSDRDGVNCPGESDEATFQY